MKKKFDFHLSYEEKEKRKKALDDVSSLSQLNIEDLQSRQWIAVYDRRGYTTTLNIGMIGNTLYIVSHDSGEYEVVEKVNTLRDLKYGLSDVPRDYAVIEPGNAPIAESDFEGYDETTIEGEDEDEDLFAEDSIKEGAKEGLLKIELKKLKENAHNRVLYSGYTLIDAVLDGDSIVLVFYKNSVTTEEPLNLVKNLNKKLHYLAVEKYRVTREGVNVILGVQGDFEENPDFRDNTAPMSKEEKLRARGLSEEQIQDYLKKLNEPIISSKQEAEPFVPDTRTKEEKLRAKGYSEEQIQEYLKKLAEPIVSNKPKTVPEKADTRTKEEKLRARGWSEEKIQEYLEAARELKAHDSKADVPKKFDFQLSYEEKLERKKALDMQNTVVESQIDELLNEAGWTKSKYSVPGYSLYQKEAENAATYFTEYSEKEQEEYAEEYDIPDERVYYIQVDHEAKTFVHYYSLIDGSDEGDFDLDAETQSIFDEAGYTETSIIVK